jgi:hypothetical protein
MLAHFCYVTGHGRDVVLTTRKGGTFRPDESADGSILPPNVNDSAAATTVNDPD